MRPAIALALLAFAASAIAQEKLSGSNIDVRTGIAFTIPAATAQKMLPDGWEVNSPPSGPSQGANLTMTFLEQVSSQDAQGATLPPFQGVAIGIPARKKDGSAAGNMIVAGLFTAGAPGAYGVYLPATGGVERRQRIDGDGKVLVEERWSFKSADGNAIEATVHYVRGPGARAKSESKVYSGVKPDFYRIYRVDLVTDVVRGATGVDRATQVSVKASGARLASLLDGNEKIVAVTSIPSYSRMVYLPGP
jgi:hypothetical protein